jgi:hypothetical protein
MVGIKGRTQLLHFCYLSKTVSHDLLKQRGRKVSVSGSGEDLSIPNHTDTIPN